MKIGFTGSRTGMTEQQRASVEQIISSLEPPGEFHHGDCQGADSQAHNIASRSGWLVVIHPPANSQQRAYRVGDLVLPPRPFLNRNRDIVDACDLLLAAPSGRESTRSGTWDTIRYARKQNKLVYVVDSYRVVEMLSASGGDV